MPTEEPRDDQPSVLEQIQGFLDYSSSLGRSTEDDCDECGTTEGSVTHIRDWPGGADEKFLCRECYNNVEVWPDE